MQYTSKYWIIEKKIHVTTIGSPLWKNTYKAWQNILFGLKSLLSKYKNKIFKELIHKNSSLVDVEGKIKKSNKNDRLI